MDIHKLLCRLGFHRWGPRRMLQIAQGEPSVGHYGGPGDGDTATVIMQWGNCEICGRRWERLCLHHATTVGDYRR